MKKHVLVTLADKNYLNTAKQLFSSAYHNGGWDGDYLLLSYNIPKKDLKWFMKKGIFIYKCGNLGHYKNNTSKNYEKNYTNQIYLCKFYLFREFFKNWDNVVFLDADIIVRKSIKELANIKGIGSTIDMSPQLKHQLVDKKCINSEKIIAIYNELEKKYSFNQKAFSAGVISFNTSLVEKDTFDKLVYLYFHYKDILKFPEQAAFNIYFYKRYKELPLVYNCPSVLLKNKDKINPVILHTIMHQRAWYKDSPFHVEWENNYKRADLIDIKNSQKPKSRLTGIKMVYYSCIIKRRLKKRYKNSFINRTMGLAGILIKKINPYAYYKLKEILKNEKACFSHTGR